MKSPNTILGVEPGRQRKGVADVAFLPLKLLVIVAYVLFAVLCIFGRIVVKVIRIAFEEE